MATRQTRARKADLPKDQPVANRQRGEHELTLEGVTYRLRPSFEANVAIEEKTKSTMLQLQQQGSAGALSLMTLGLIAQEWIRAGATDEATANVGAKQLARLIQEESVVATTVIITGCLLDVVLGGRTASGEVKAAAA